MDRQSRLGTLQISTEFLDQHVADRDEKSKIHKYASHQFQLSSQTIYCTRFEDVCWRSATGNTASQASYHAGSFGAIKQTAVRDALAPVEVAEAGQLRQNERAIGRQRQHGAIVQLPQLKVHCCQVVCLHRGLLLLPLVEVRPVDIERHLRAGRLA